MLVFIGDYADRGDEGVEVIERIFQLLKFYPQRVIALKGNHEDYTDQGVPKFAPCHLIAEAERKWGSWELFFQTVFQPFSQLLNATAIIPGEALFVHGGVSEKLQSVSDLDNPSPELVIDLIYSDSTLRFDDQRPNLIRGIGVRYGPNITKAVCERLNVKRVFRGHQHDMAKTGPSVLHEGRLVTLITGRVYIRNPYVLLLDPANPASSANVLTVSSGKIEHLDFDSQQNRSLQLRFPLIRKSQLTKSQANSVAQIKKSSKPASREAENQLAPKD